MARSEVYEVLETEVRSSQKAEKAEKTKEPDYSSAAPSLSRKSDDVLGSSGKSINDFLREFSELQVPKDSSVEELGEIKQATARAVMRDNILYMILFLSLFVVLATPFRIAHFLLAVAGFGYSACFFYLGWLHYNDNVDN